jgi:cyclase
MTGWRLEEVGPGVFARVGERPLQPNSGIIVGDDGVTVIDSGYSTEAGRELQADIRRVTPLPVVRVIISHHHFDHAWGNDAFSDARIIGHENARRNMLGDQEPYREQMLRFVPTLTGWYGVDADTLTRRLGATRITPPTETFGQRLDLDLGGHRAELFNFGAGHTDGDTLVYLPEEKVVFGGDLVCNHVIPNAADGDPLHWFGILAAIEEIDMDVIVPGHGPVGGRLTVCDFDACLSTITREVRRALEDGAPDPRAASARLRLGDFGDWAGGELLAGTVRKVYRTLEASRSV